MQAADDAHMSTDVQMKGTSSLGTVEKGISSLCVWSLDSNAGCVRARSV